MAWDSTLVNKQIDQRVGIVLSRFEANDTADGTKYSLGGLYVRECISYVSKKAVKRIPRKERNAIVRGRGVKYNRVKPGAWGVTREHMIPISDMYEHLVRVKELSGGKLPKECIARLMPKMHIALITKRENRKFKRKKRGVDLTCSMPAGWWDTTALDPLDRYRAVGLGDDIWEMDFLNDDMSPRP